jgi:hypothetical protein
MGGLSPGSDFKPPSEPLTQYSLLVADECRVDPTKASTKIVVVEVLAGAAGQQALIGIIRTLVPSP